MRMITSQRSHIRKKLNMDRKDKKTYLPTHIFISSFKAVGLRTNSIAQCEQLCDVKDTDLIEKIGKVSKNQLRQITKGMQIQLGMSTKHNNPIA